MTVGKTGIVAAFALLMGCQVAEEAGTETLTRTDDASEPVDASRAPLAVGIGELEPYGAYLTDVVGRPLYVFGQDTPGEGSSCYDECAESWPPVLVDEAPVPAAVEVHGWLLGTVLRNDGYAQATYDGWPLYYYSEDGEGGEVSGHDRNAFGGQWHLAVPGGRSAEIEAPRPEPTILP